MKKKGDSQPLQQAVQDGGNGESGLPVVWAVEFE